MDKLIEAFRIEVITAAKDPSFVHHEWFVKYHLEIVERIALELCDIYIDADRDLVRIMVWLHDYGKILDFPNQYETTLTKGKEKLIELGFDNELVDKLIQYVDIMDKKEDLFLDKIPIEVKIVSSADGAAHLVGPFFNLYLYENANKPFEELMEDNINKAMKDWYKKIVLPEVRKVFETRHNILLENSGQIPDKFLSE